MPKRQRASIITHFPQGILLTLTDGDTEYLLPGGGIEPGESALEGGIRELEEETALKAYDPQFLFTHESYYHQHQVIEVKSKGVPTPQNEIIKLAYYQPHSTIKISQGTQDILNTYFTVKNHNL